MATKSKKFDIDTEIERIYNNHFTGKEINVFDIGKVFKAGRDAYANGQDVEHAVVTVATGLVR